MTNYKLKIGEHFIYNGIEWICLDIINCDYLAITAEVICKLPFDANNYNDWKESSLRKFLNEEFLSKFNKKHLVIQKSDLTAYNGDTVYGTCQDYVAILSNNQYFKYRKLIPDYREKIWTLTPFSRSKYAQYSGDVCNVSSSSGCDAYNASCRLGIAPTCIFSYERLKVCHQVSLVEADAHDIYSKAL